MKFSFTLLLLFATYGSFAQTTEKLTVEKIMRDPKWMGTSPANVRWSDNGNKIYFDWNPSSEDSESLYSVTISDLKPQKVGLEERKNSLPGNGSWNRRHTQKVYERNGDIYMYDAKGGKITQVTNTLDRESNPVFSGDESRIIFLKAENLYAVDQKSGELIQLTNFTRGASATTASAQVVRRGSNAGGSGTATQTGLATAQDRWLKGEQTELFDVIREKDKTDKDQAADRKLVQPKRPKEISIADQVLNSVQVSPDNNFITYRLITQPEGVKTTIVPNYVTASGYTEDIANRTKVGTPQPVSQTFVYDTRRDTVYSIITSDIPGIKDLPDYVKDYPKQLEERTKRNEDRKVVVHGPYWSDDGHNAIVVVTAQDNKDRWIMKLDAQTGKLSLLDRQRDEAWIGGPGIGGGGFSGGNVGWIDNTHIYFQSEASGYSHIYVADVTTAAKTQLTSGKWEVQGLSLSNDKKAFYFTANMEHPGITHYYKLPVTGGTPLKLTTIKGGNQVELSPDEKWLAILYSYSNKPWELYLQPNRAGAKAVQVTNSTTAEFNAYPWREPQMVTFKNRYGNDVYARLYVPANPDPAKPAVVFVHGAGYLQNVHYYWSSYFHEYMFNNLLADQGYTVLDIDYTGSAGYGRDWRTGIYRHMGGKDLTDQVDGVKMLVDKYGVNPSHVGLYGGSYGGFITLMAMFNEPGVFAAGAGLRSVTDWAHYNHGYTDNILNEPFNDEKAYRASSPIYFAQGLKGHLLMAHGMVDQNVNFQDIVRLTQRLIELHKDNWSLAPYPVEDHGFVQPSSWTDEYKRILKFFDETLKK